MDGWIIQILGWIGAFVLGVLVNLVTPAVKSFFQKSYLSLRERNIRAFKDEYLKLREYKDNQSTLIVELIRKLVVGLIFVVVLIGLSVATLTSGFRGNFQDNFLNSTEFYGILIGYIVSRLLEIPSLIDKVVNLEGFKTKTNKILAKWGASLDDELPKKSSKKTRI